MYTTVPPPPLPISKIKENTKIIENTIEVSVGHKVYIAHTMSTIVSPSIES